MATTEERVRRLEGGFEHLATKADVANLKVWIMGLLLTVVVSVFRLRRESDRSTRGLTIRRRNSGYPHHAVIENSEGDCRLHEPLACQDSPHGRTMRARVISLRSKRHPA